MLALFWTYSWNSPKSLNFTQYSRQVSPLCNIILYTSTSILNWSHLYFQWMRNKVEIMKSVYAVHKIGKKLLWGKLSIHDNFLLLHAFDETVPSEDAVFVPVSTTWTYVSICCFTPVKNNYRFFSIFICSHSWPERWTNTPSKEEWMESNFPMNSI